MFDFYNICFKMEYLTIEEIREACKWNVITKEEFKTITNIEY